MKKIVRMIVCLSAVLVLALSISYLNTNIVKAEEDGTNYQEVEPGTSVNENTTNEDKKDDWSDFFNNEENRQTEESLDNSSDLTEEQQNESNDAVGAVSQDKTAYSPEVSIPHR